MPGEASGSMAYIDLNSMQYLRKQLFVLTTDDKGEATASHMMIGYNSLITPLKEKGQRAQDESSPIQKTNGLSRTQQCRNV